MNTEQKCDIIKQVMGNPVRSSAYGLAGERNPMPYACVDDYGLDAMIFISGASEDEAVSMLYDDLEKRYPHRFASKANAMSVDGL